MIHTYYKKEKHYKEASRPYRSKEGDRVFSKGELEIANFLHEQNIGYNYEPMREIEGRMWSPDFYLYNLDIYIEFQGMADDEQSRKRYAARYMALKNASYEVIYLYPSQLGSLGDVIIKRLKDLQKI